MAATGAAARTPAHQTSGVTVHGPKLLSSLVAVATAGVLGAALVAGPAHAEPKGAPPPDATMFCGPDHQQVAYVFPTVGADAVWLLGGPYQGKWSFLSYQHYLAEGVLLHDYVPVEQLPGLYGPSLDGKSFGTKAGKDEVLDCEIVSRWAGPQPYTVVGPVVLAR